MSQGMLEFARIELPIFLDQLKIIMSENVVTSLAHPISPRRKDE